MACTICFHICTSKLRGSTRQSRDSLVARAHESACMGYTFHISMHNVVAMIPVHSISSLKQWWFWIWLKPFQYSACLTQNSSMSLRKWTLNIIRRHGSYLLTCAYQTDKGGVHGRWLALANMTPIYTGIWVPLEMTDRLLGSLSQWLICAISC